MPDFEMLNESERRIADYLARHTFVEKPQVVEMEKRLREELSRRETDIANMESELRRELSDLRLRMQDSHNAELQKCELVMTSLDKEKSALVKSKKGLLAACIFLILAISILSWLVFPKKSTTISQLLKSKERQKANLIKLSDSELAGLITFSREKNSIQVRVPKGRYLEVCASNHGIPTMYISSESSGKRFYWTFEKVGTLRSPIVNAQSFTDISPAQILTSDNTDVRVFDFRLSKHEDFPQEAIITTKIDPSSLGYIDEESFAVRWMAENNNGTYISVIMTMRGF